MHPYDRYFYDPDRETTVAKYLADLTARYGGVDAILMCPPMNIGIDDRNQFDFFRTMPGGLDAVTAVTKEPRRRVCACSGRTIRGHGHAAEPPTTSTRSPRFSSKPMRTVQRRHHELRAAELL